MAEERWSLTSGSRADAIRSIACLEIDKKENVPSGEAETEYSPTPQGLRRGRIPVETRRSLRGGLGVCRIHRAAVTDLSPGLQPWVAQAFQAWVFARRNSP